MQKVVLSRFVAKEGKSEDVVVEQDVPWYINVLYLYTMCANTITH